MVPFTTTAAQLNQNRQGLTELLDIEFVEVGADYLIARMPVDERHIQPYGILHGGASVVLAETIGSVAAMLSVESKRQFCVGLEVNANHLWAVPKGSGFVYAKATPVHRGKTTQVWDIIMTNEEGRKTCVSRLTVAVREGQLKK